MASNVRPTNVRHQYASLFNGVFFMSTTVPPVEITIENRPVATIGVPGVVPTDHVLPLDLWPSIDHIITEDEAPMDNVFSEKQQRLLTEPLYTSWQPGRPFVAMANVGLFFAPKQFPFVPDALLSLDVSFPQDLHPKANRSYFVWEYGKPPNIVIEIVSNKEGREDTEKIIGYARMGIAYYVIYDPERHLSDEALRVFQLRGMNYQQVTPSPTNAYPLSEISLGFALWHGEFEGCTDDWLRWIDTSGVVVPTGAEQAATERQLAETERNRADAEQSRAEKLAEQLRRIGIQPEA